MIAWQRAFLLIFFVVGVIFIGRQSPSGSGEMQVTEFSDVAPAEEVIARVEEQMGPPAPVAVIQPVVAPVVERPARKVAAIRDVQPKYKGQTVVGVDMTDYQPEPRQSRVTASVEKQLVLSKGRYALADAIAVETDKYKPSMGEEIEEKAGFTVFKPADKNALKGFALAETTRPVVVNQASGAIGIVTGTIVVRLKDFEQADALASAFGMEVVSTDDTIATVFYRAPKDRELDDLLELLREDGRVARADAEIIQSTRQVH